MPAQQFKKFVLIFIITVFAGYQISFAQLFGSEQEFKRSETITESIGNAEVLELLMQEDIRGGHITVIPSKDKNVTIEVEYIVVATDTSKGEEHFKGITTTVEREDQKLTVSSKAPRDTSLFFNTGGFPKYIKKEQVNYIVKMPPVLSIKKVKIVTDNGDIRINEMQFKDYVLRNDDSSVILTSCLGDRVDIGTDNGNISTDQCEFSTVKANADDGSMFISGVKEKVQLNVDNGNINLKNCKGEINLSADDGNISLNSITGSLSISIDNGRIESDNSNFNDVKVSIDDGRVRLGNANGEIRITTDNGDIHLNDSKGEIIYSTDDGNVMLNNCSGSVRGQTDNGHIQIQNGFWDEITLNVDDGNIKVNSNEVADTELKLHGDNTHIEVNLPQTKEVQIQTKDGNVQLNIPVIHEEANIITTNGQIHTRLNPSSPYKIMVKTKNGRIENNLPLQDVNNEPKNELTGKLGNGSIPIKLESKNGSIHLN